ncbi:MAG: zinc ABC transporter substrate-binding protein, partial [Alistipes sp.]|nr:zinc ABC transporter substrate-binding protein [Alistipes sp.]
MYVTIAPLAEIVGGITGDDFTLEVLVPAGASPETFEPTPKQFMALNESKAVFAIGLIDFETALTARMADASKVVDLSRGIATETGCCSHHAHGAHHAHGVDPHVWTSPRQLKIMARNAYEAIHAMYPDSAKYTSAFEKLEERL